MREKRDCWVCEYADCGHVWIASGTDAPEQCAKCRRRRWNTGQDKKPKKMIITPTEPEKLKAEPKPAGSTEPQKSDTCPHGKPSRRICSIFSGGCEEK